MSSGTAPTIDLHDIPILDWAASDATPPHMARRPCRRIFTRYKSFVNLLVCYVLTRKIGVPQIYWIVRRDINWIMCFSLLLFHILETAVLLKQSTMFTDADAY